MGELTLYFALAGVGGVLLLIGLFLDEFIELDGFPVTISLGVALLVTGGMGLILGPGKTQAFISGGVGVLALLIVGFITRYLRKDEYTGRIISFENLPGRVVQQEWWNEEKQEGEVLVEVSGNIIKVPASTEENLTSSEAKKIKNYQASGETLIRVTLEKA